MNLALITPIFRHLLTNNWRNSAGRPRCWSLLVSIVTFTTGSGNTVRVIRLASIISSAPLCPEHVSRSTLSQWVQQIPPGKL